MKKHENLSNMEAIPTVITSDSPNMAQKELKNKSRLSDAEKYKAAFEKMFKALPPWKQAVILSKNYEDRICKEFAKEVIIQAEQEN